MLVLFHHSHLDLRESALVTGRVVRKNFETMQANLLCNNFIKQLKYSTCVVVASAMLP